MKEHVFGIKKIDYCYGSHSDALAKDNGIVSIAILHRVYGQKILLPLTFMLLWECKALVKLVTRDVPT